MKKRKKAALAVYALFVIIALLTLSAIMVNLMQGMQMATRVHQAAEEGARVRAQAIDILLKEQEGIMEVLHPGAGYSDNVDHTAASNKAGHVNPILPQSSTYQTAKRTADSEAIDATLDFIKYSIGKEVKGKDNIVQVTKNDMCFDFEPLPGDPYDGFDPSTATPGDLDNTVLMDFSCTTPNGDTIVANDVRVSDIHHNTVKVDDKNGKIMTVRSVNVVFIGIHFKYTYFMNEAIAKFGLSKTSQGNVFAVAYPQVDKCVRTEATCTY